MDRIVVGVDGSPSSVAALRWAMRLARETGAEIEAVHAWDLTYAWIDGYAPDIGLWAKRSEQAAQARLDRTVDSAVLGASRAPSVTRTLVEGPPARVLLDSVKEADLLVVGSRGHGGFAGLLLGSVSQQCVHHARVPVMVVPDLD